MASLMSRSETHKHAKTGGNGHCVDHKLAGADEAITARPEKSHVCDFER